MANLRSFVIIIQILILVSSQSLAQNRTDSSVKRSHDWWQADWKKDSIPGISLDKAYTLLKGRKSKTVIVAIIDNCVDTAHEELKDRIWTNTKEIPDNGIDDDHNGYVDDVHGWCFIANKYNQAQTKQIAVETLVYKTWKNKFENKDTTKISKYERVQYDMYKTAEKLIFERYQFFRAAAILHSDSAKFVKYVDHLLPDYGDKKLNQIPFLTLPYSNAYDSAANYFFAVLIKIIPIKSSLRQYDSLLNTNKNYFRVAFNLSRFDEQYKYDTTLNFRTLIGDDPDNFNDKVYGTPAVNLPEIGGEHATLIAGIITANRQNNAGIKGIADNILIMPLITAVPNGISISKDIVMAIHYAVDNGAFIINMSMGHTPWMNEHEKELRGAFDYADSHNVMIINSAGNDGLNLDNEKYRIGQGSNGKDHDTYIRVSSSTALMNDSLVSLDSQYGGRTADIFAPGTDIYSTSPGNKYESRSGTSLACPVVTGVAALLKSYFPELTAKQVKEIIMESAFKPDVMVVPPNGSVSREKVPFKSLSKSGGIINAYNAVQMADKIVKDNY
jgi:cell wall-associated protease